jgi:hypothetical protein
MEKKLLNLRVCRQTRLLPPQSSISLTTMSYKKKLIEVALPLEAINKESAREKSIRHGHPSTLHLWWSRKPTATCRAVIFASLIDDPSSHPDKFPTEAAQEGERQRLFNIIGEIITIDTKGKAEQVVKGLVSWDSINEPEIIEKAQKEMKNRQLHRGRCGNIYKNMHHQFMILFVGVVLFLWRGKDWVYKLMAVI